MSKTDDLIAQMEKDWTPVSDLLVLTGWLPHTLRAAISVKVKRAGLKVERRRVDGVTSYRIVP